MGAEMEELLTQPSLRHVSRPYQRGDLTGQRLAFAATDEAETNAAVFEEAEALGLLVNVVDDPGSCRFLVPSKLERGPITIAISTAGASPALARHLRERLEEAVPEAYGALAELLGRLRPEVKAAYASGEERARRWKAVLESGVLELLERGREEEAEREARRILGLQEQGECR